jgi:hypothetical protein
LRRKLPAEKLPPFRRNELIGREQGIEREEKGIECSDGRREKERKVGEVCGNATREVKGNSQERSPLPIPTGRSASSVAGEYNISFIKSTY